MTIALPVRAAPGASVAWRQHGIVLAAVATGLVALFAADAGAMVATWWYSTTFQHCLVVVAILGWLVWQRRHEVAALTPTAWWPGLAIVAGGGAVWLVGEAGAVTVLRQLGLIVMLQGAVVALLGPRVAQGLLFPLGYALFLVPFGEWMEAPLQALTVRLALPLLHLCGIAAGANGVVIHAGRYWFEVAEACSGAKFVIAMLAVGVLVAQLCFLGWQRRAAFLLACVVVPLLANGVRAAATMAVANWTSVEAAAGFDHIVYGWLWFALVMATTLAIGWRWFDKPADARAFDPAILSHPAAQRLALLPAVVLAMSIAAGFAAWGASVAARETALPARLALPVVPGWRLVSLGTRAPWYPLYPGADRRLIGRYLDAGGNAVDLAIVVYRGQHEGKSVVAYGTGPVGDGWLRIADVPPIAGASALRIVAVSRDGRPIERIVTTRYTVGGTATTSPAVVKLATLGAHLFGGSQVATATHLSVEVEPGRDPITTIARFAAALNGRR